MSADNYMLIRIDGTKFVVSMGFASDSRIPDVHRHDHRCDTLGEALKYAEDARAEYGVTMSEDVQTLLATLMVPRLVVQPNSIAVQIESGGAGKDGLWGGGPGNPYGS